MLFFDARFFSAACVAKCLHLQQRVGSLCDEVCMWEIVLQSTRVHLQQRVLKNILASKI